ncbi:MAG: PAS domain S-box protein, partial [Myxococcales bacterium]
AHLLESAADGIAVIGHDGRLQMANPRALDLVGSGGQKASAVRVSDFLIADDAPLLERLWQGFRAGFYPQGVDLRLRRTDGAVITVNANFSMLRGEPVVVATFRDVTAERATSRELSKTKGFLENVIESCADGILSASETGVVRLFNRAAERCTGFQATEVVGQRRVEEFFLPGVAQQIQQMVQRRGGRLEAFRTELLTRSGECIPVLLSSSQIVEGGVVTGSVAVFSDLRERLRMESRLVAAQEELKLRERQAIVAELAGAAAHELNQPLTSVMGYAEMIKRKLAPDAPAFAAADVILGEAARMAEIVRKLGTVARYETKSYVGQAKILDLDLASQQPPDTAPERPSPTLVPPSAPTQPSSSSPGGPPTEIPPSTPENSS